MNERDAHGSNAATPVRLEAVLFDMDGVVTDTAQAHAAAWKCLFDEFLRSVRDHEPRRTAADYAVADTGEVRRLIEWLAAMTAEKPDRTERGDEV